MIALEFRRLIRRYRTAHILATLLLAVGFAGSSLAALLLLVLSSSDLPGLLPAQYGTIAEQSSGGASKPIPWSTLARVQQAAAWSDPATAAYTQPIGATLRYDRETVQVSVAGASQSFFANFANRLSAGENFNEVGDGSQDNAEAIVSYGLAQRLFGRATEAIQRTVALDGQQFDIVAVAPKEFSGLWSKTDLWIAPKRFALLDIGPQGRASAKSPMTANLGELWKDVPLFYLLTASKTLSGEGMRQGWHELIQRHPEWNTRLQVSDGLTRDPVQDAKVRSWSRTALILSAALILAASLNYCGLLLADSPNRMEEVRLKRVLGAGAKRIMIEQMCGPAITVGAGFALGAFSAALGIRLLISHEGAAFAWPGLSIRPIALVLLIEAALVALLAITVGLIPALRLTRDAGLSNLGYTSTARGGAVRLLQGIVSLQIASCIAICLAAVSVIGSVRALSKEPLGFDARHLVALKMAPSGDSRSVEFTTGSGDEFPLAKLTRLSLEVGSSAAEGRQLISASSCAPLDAPLKSLTVQAADAPSSPTRSVSYCAVSQNFFRTLQNPIIAGRGFSTASMAGEPAEVVVNQRLAQDLWPGASPLHRMIALKHPVWDLQFTAEVVGVSENMRFAGASHPPEATVYLPLKGNAFTLAFPLYFLVSGRGTPRSLEALIDRQASVTMPSLAVGQVTQVEESLQASSLEQDMRMWLVAVSALLVSLIAYLGLYGALVNFVNTRRKEMALRACFGASGWDMRRLVMRQAAICSVIGVLVSTLGCQTLSRVVAGEWLEYFSWSWRSALAVCLACAGSAMLLSLFPANGAVCDSPASVLKEQ